MRARVHIFIDLLDETQNSGRDGRSAEIGPLRLLKLCNLAHGMEWKSGVRKGEVANDDSRRI